MDENKTQPKQNWFTPRNIIIGVVVLAATIGMYIFSQGGQFFQASLLNLSSVPAFNGTVMPLNKTLDWTHLTSQEYTDFKAGTLTYSTAGSKLINLMNYDATTLCNTDPTTLGWSGNDLNIRNLFLTYVTAYVGKYTSGAATACELAGSHPAVDIRAAKGTPVYAIANGMVVKKKSDSSNGNIVCITHPNVPDFDNPSTKVNYTSCYLHMDMIADGMAEGVVVNKGQQIGTVGNTGLATTYHLHFQLDKEIAPYHPFWPFTSAEAQAAGCNFFDCINQGLGKDKAIANTVNVMKWVQANLNYNQTATAGTGDTPPANNSGTTTNNQNNTTTNNQNATQGSGNNNTTVPNNANTNPTSNVNAATTTNTNATPVNNSNTNSDLLFFSDVSASHPNYDAIKYLKQQNIVAGNPDGTFGPNSTINRAALAKILVEAKYKGQATGTNCFSDVKDEWFAPYVCFAKEKGIVGGYNDGTFKPNNNVSFVEAAKMISVALGYSNGSSPTIPWYQMFVDILGTKKAIPTTIIGFNQQITRAEMSEIMYRLLANIINKTSNDFSILLQSGV